MVEKIKTLIEEVNGFASNDAKEIEAFRIRFLGKKGTVPGLFSKLKQAKDEEKKVLGNAVNQLKALAQEKITLLKNNLQDFDAVRSPVADLTLPGDPLTPGTRHPISIVKNKIQ